MAHALAKLLDEAEADRDAIAGFLLRLRRLGITDHRIAQAFEAAPRRLFVPYDVRGAAYVERPLPIECGQTISAPEVVGIMTAALDVRATDRVLEIGTGSGYQTAVLARLARRVFTIDRFRTLVETAEMRFRTLKLDNVTTRIGDGHLGWPEEAPFDRVIVTAAASAVPEALLAQLKTGGQLVMPVGPPEGLQRLVKLVKGDDGVVESFLADVRFVPMIPGVAERL